MRKITNGIIVMLLILIIIGGAYTFFLIQYQTKEYLSVPENISRNVKEICEKEGKVACAGNCIDGDYAKCYFDSIRYNKVNLARSYSDAWKACFGIIGGATCKPCSKNFLLVGHNDSFKRVSCEEFFQVIENKNKECNDCVDNISFALYV